MTSRAARLVEFAGPDSLGDAVALRRSGTFAAQHH